jgi:hypothetical protein
MADSPIGCNFLYVIDDVTRECLVAVPDTSICGKRVARKLTGLIEQRGRPVILIKAGKFYPSAVQIMGADQHKGRDSSSGRKKIQGQVRTSPGIGSR